MSHVLFVTCATLPSGSCGEFAVPPIVRARCQLTRPRHAGRRPPAPSRLQGRPGAVRSVSKAPGEPCGQLSARIANWPPRGGLPDGGHRLPPQRLPRGSLFPCGLRGAARESAACSGLGGRFRPSVCASRRRGTAPIVGAGCQLAPARLPGNGVRLRRPEVTTGTREDPSAWSGCASVANCPRALSIGRPRSARRRRGGPRCVHAVTGPTPVRAVRSTLAARSVRGSPHGIQHLQGRGIREGPAVRAVPGRRGGGAAAGGSRPRRARVAVRGAPERRVHVAAGGQGPGGEPHARVAVDRMHGPSARTVPPGTAGTGEAEWPAGRTPGKLCVAGPPARGGADGTAGAIRR